MMRASVCVAAIAAAVFVAACGGDQDSSPAAAAPAVTPSAPATAASAAAPKAGVVTLIEPMDGAMSGHIDTFRWSPVADADGYVITITAVTGNRIVWQSDPMTVTETKLPPTVALEPEAHVWKVDARKGNEVIATSAVQRFTITP